MGSNIIFDQESGLYMNPETRRKFFLDEPDDLGPDEEFTFLFNLHGGGSHGVWQRLYFPAHDYKEKYRLVIVAPTAKTKEPARRWMPEADDAWLKDILEFVFDRYGTNRIKAFWMVGHSQGGMTTNRLLQTDYYADRVDGWLSLSGGRIGRVELPASFFAGRERPKVPARATGGAVPGLGVMLEADLSFIFSTGELEILELPETSPWAEKYGAAPRVRMPDVVDTEKGQVWDDRADRGPAWGREPRPGTAQMYVYPNAKDGRVIADIVRLDKGHTEGYEPRITNEILKLLLSAPGGKLRML